MRLCNEVSKVALVTFYFSLKLKYSVIKAIIKAIIKRKQTNAEYT